MTYTHYYLLSMLVIFCFVIVVLLFLMQKQQLFNERVIPDLFCVHVYLAGSGFIEERDFISTVRKFWKPVNSEEDMVDAFSVSQ